MSLPLARTDHLVVHDLSEETLVFDQRHNKAHCLNRTTALVWKHCDGRTDLAALARLLKHDAPASAEVLVQLALEQLASRHLLEGDIVRDLPTQRRSRRDLLKRLAAAAVMLPVILTVTAPRANAAGSKATTCPSGQVLCLGACITPIVVDNIPCTADCQCASRLCISTGGGMFCEIP